MGSDRSPQRRPLDRFDEDDNFVATTSWTSTTPGSPGPGPASPPATSSPALPSPPVGSRILSSARMQQQHRLADGNRQPPTRQRDEAPVDDWEYIHEQPAAQPGPPERLRQLVKRRLVLLRAESLLHRPRLAGDPAAGLLAGQAPLPPGRRDIPLISQRGAAQAIPVLDARKDPMTGTLEQIAPGPASIRSCRSQRAGCCPDRSAGTVPPDWMTWPGWPRGGPPSRRGGIT